MDPALEEVIANDEELRARVSAAGAAAKERIEAARVARQRRDEQQVKDAEEKLGDELAAIAESAQREVEKRRQRRAEWATAREKSASALRQSAAEAWARIVCGV